MARRKAVKVNPSRLLTMAAQRVELPALPVRIEYDADGDTLYLRFKDGLNLSIRNPQSAIGITTRLESEPGGGVLIV